MRPVQRFWYGWKMWSFAFTATWHACPQSEGLGSAVNLSDASSNLARYGSHIGVSIIDKSQGLHIGLQLAKGVFF